MERVSILAEIITFAAAGNEQAMKQKFEELCKMSNCKTRGRTVDMTAITTKAASLIKKIMDEDGENVTPSLASIGALIGVDVIEQETEEGNESEVVS